MTEPGVGTNRYAYSFNDPVNLSDRNGNDAIYEDEDGNWQSSDGSNYDPETGEETYDFGSDAYGYTVAQGLSPAETSGVQSPVHLSSSGRSRVISASVPSYRDGEDGVVYEGHTLYTPTSPFEGSNSATNSYQMNALEREVAIAAGYQGPAIYGAALEGSSFMIGIGSAPAATSFALFGASGSRVFWTGSTAGRTMMGDAAIFASQNGMRTLEMTNAGWLATQASKVVSNRNLTGKIWAAASSGFARTARDGSVLIKGAKTRVGSIWNTIERPILNGNGVKYSVTDVVK